MDERRRFVVGGAVAVAAAVAVVVLATGSEDPEEPGGVDAAPARHRCVEARLSEGAEVPDRWTDGEDHAVVTSEPVGDCTRRYTLETTAALRDDLPDNPRTVEEHEDAPRVRTGNAMFDALYALALEEVREASVDEISDGAFDEGRPLRCPNGGCFETGRLWTYVWTRDTAYATHLSLASLDPTRARNSLDFKLSERRGGGDLQIVQDTGSGGSWPISTDRVTWALGAREVLVHLEGAEREQFRARALEALRNTIARDRAVAFDERTGLYRGEQSFLDWREQSYPAWTANDTMHIGTSRALSTNVAHLAALRTAAELAQLRTRPDVAGEAGDAEASERWAAWADALARAIDERLWLEDAGMWSTFTTTELDPAPARRFDLLGTALAVLEGVGGEEHARRAVASYPHLPKGPPVMWPQQRNVPIYHNRALWPFVTSYWVRAARRVENDAAVTEGVRSLVRGGALNLSNMENFEMVTGAPWVDEGDLSGPVVNSQRQLWSVAGYVSMVHDVLFGVETTRDGISFRPYVTRDLRNGMFAAAETLVLDGLWWRGRRITVVVHLPPRDDGTGGAYRVGEVRLDGEAAPDRPIGAADLADSSRVDVTLLPDASEPASIVRVSEVEDARALFGPEPPVVESVKVSGPHLALDLAAGEEGDGIAYRIYRDGELVADALPARTERWVDRDASSRGPSRCYTAEAYYTSSGNTSQRARPACWWGRRSARRRTFAVGQLEVSGGEPRSEDGRDFVAGWGAKDDTAELAFTAAEPDAHLVRLVARNHAGPINTGITCGVKRLEVREAETDEVVASGYVMVPHTAPDPELAWQESSAVRATLEAGRRYRIVLGGGEHATNMSALAHFERYTGGRGGREGPRNRFDLAAIEVLARGSAEGSSTAPTP